MSGHTVPIVDIPWVSDHTYGIRHSFRDQLGRRRQRGLWGRFRGPPIQGGGPISRGRGVCAKLHLLFFAPGHCGRTPCRKQGLCCGPYWLAEFDGVDSGGVGKLGLSVVCGWCAGAPSPLCQESCGAPNYISFSRPPFTVVARHAANRGCAVTHIGWPNSTVWTPGG